MGEHTAYRVKAFGSAFHEICTKYEEGPSATLPPQLGVTREALHRWTLEEYAKEAHILMEKFQEKAEDGLNGLPQSRKLTNSVHHFAHALEHSGTIEEIRLAETLRTEVFELVYLNLNRKRAENERNRKETGRVLEDWPEMMKNVAEAGQNLLQIGTPARRREVGKRVMDILVSFLHIINMICIFFYVII